MKTFVLFFHVQNVKRYFISGREIIIKKFNDISFAHQKNFRYIVAA